MSRRAPGWRLFGGFRTRAALGLGPLTAPVMVFIPIGILLGPRFSGILSETALAHLDVVVSIALATLGVFIGLALGREGRKATRLFAASSIEALTTIAIVSGAAYVLLLIWRVPVDLSYGLLALSLGLCASASAAPAVDLEGDRAADVAARVADLDDVVPIVIGGAVIILAGPGARSPLEGAALTVALGLSVGFAGWLLIERAEGAAERGGFMIGALALLGGVSAYLHLSPLLAGMAAGWLWVLAPGRCDLLVARDLRKVQHPLVVLLLLTVGASLKASILAIWLFAPYLIFRLAGKLIGGWTAARIAPGVAPADLGAYLLPPGVIGIAFALNVEQVAHEAATALVFAVAAGALASELLALFLTPQRRVA